MKLFLYLILVIPFASTTTAVTYNKKMNMPESLRKINLIYSHDFTNQNYWNTPIPADCFFMFDSSAATGFTFKPVLRCIEHISLLRSDATATHWQREQNQHGFFMLNLPDTGIHHVHARIKSILPSVYPLNGNPLISGSLISKNNSTVIGVFKRHSSSVKSWLFKTLSTGKLSTIHATPTHQFYVKYLNEWLPLSKITSDMTLIDSQNNTVSLVCNHSRQHCGIPWHPGRITTIYNLKVYKKHDYFAGEQMLLVHNCGGNTSFKSKFVALFSLLDQELEPKNENIDARELWHNNKLNFQDASNEITRILRNNIDARYNSDNDFFSSVEKAVETYNHKMQESGLPHMIMDFKVEQKLDDELSVYYHSLTFSLHYDPYRFVTVPFTREDLTMISGNLVVKAGHYRSYIDVGTIEDGHYHNIGLMDRKPSDDINTSRAVPGLFHPLF